MAVTAPLVNSSSTVTRVATHFAIGSVSEVTSGTISRFAGGMINTGDVGESLRQAFDPKSMLFDAALGGAVNSVQGINKPQQSFADLMSPEDAARYNQYWDDVAHGIDTDTRVRLMLMYGKEASNRKQEIDRQHYTIPNQRPKDKHCGKI
ncbi:MAG: hypothetical protein U0M06_06560 [Clostridia bacterium]|nr:hypothetical protein [Clostridia bacterium]